MPKGKKVEEAEAEAVEEEAKSLEELLEESVLGEIAELRLKVSALEDNYSVLEEMITKNQEITEAKEPRSKEEWAAIGWIKEGFEKGQLKWETIVPRADDGFIYQQTKVEVYRGKKMTVPHCIATEIRSREAR